MKTTGWHLNTFGVAPQSANPVGGPSLRDARTAGLGASLSAGRAKLPAREFLRQLLPQVASGLSFAAAVKRLPPGSGSRKRLARLLSRLPEPRHGRLDAVGKLQGLLALPDRKLLPPRKARRARRGAGPRLRRMMRLAPEARLRRLETYATLRRRGVTGHKAAQQVGAGRTSLWRWQRKFAGSGLAGLATQFHRSGRKPALTVAVPAAVLAAVRRLNVELGGNLPAWRAYLALAECPPKLRTALQGKAIPAALLAATRLNRSKVVCFTGPGLLAVGPLPGHTEKFHFLNA